MTRLEVMQTHDSSLQTIQIREHRRSHAAFPRLWLLF